jgi:hypothetical protein
MQEIERIMRSFADIQAFFRNGGISQSREGLNSGMLLFTRRPIFISNADHTETGRFSCQALSPLGLRGTTRAVELGTVPGFVVSATVIESGLTDFLGCRFAAPAGDSLR